MRQSIKSYRKMCSKLYSRIFHPNRDDPFDFGRIAAANALSDVYEMGGKPIFANGDFEPGQRKTVALHLPAKVMEGAKSIVQSCWN